MATTKLESHTNKNGQLGYARPRKSTCLSLWDEFSGRTVIATNPRHRWMILGVTPYVTLKRKNVVLQLNMDKFIEIFERNNDR